VAADAADNSFTEWKPTEANPEFANHCRRICERYSVEYYSFDVIRSAVEDSVRDAPIAGSVPLDDNTPELRRFVYEDHPAYWNLPPLVIVFRIEPEPENGPREFTLLEIWTEEELAELA
jgi:hypothetical protein